MRQYVTIQGDTWDIVAHRMYGDERKMTLLMNANPDYAHIVVFGSGVKLFVPDAPIESADTLPPWKRGDDD
ncbi:tail protein X [Paenibacillus sp. 481]|uniref:tail protein X n=1 Tax=Paenibacillus sp. 481 TaxID=2835869 RepID=UPI001E2A3B70|nr:tail protein X [Paenibacillus sp. 481]UHA74459.1 tail protein X [Paenibacillus sp. 481]